MSLVFPILAIAGLAAAAAPIVIHLLSRLRRRVVRWGAMDFLLASHRMSRLLVRFNELLLLVARVLIVCVGGVLIAGPEWTSDFSGELSTDGARRVVVVDDSYSMGEQTPGGSPWADALRIVDKLAEGSPQDTPIKLVRYSDAAFSEAGDALGPEALRADGVSQLAVGPADALAECFSWLAAEESEAAVYWVSDFRQGQDATSVTDAARRLASVAKQLVICPCGETNEASNLVVENASFEASPLASGSEATLRIAVRNRGLATSESTLLGVRLREAELPAVRVAPLAPGDAAEVDLSVRLIEGPNDLRLRLPTDAIELDGERHVTVVAPTTRPVVLLDGSTRGEERLAFSAALAPNGLPTGWRVETSRVTQIEAAFVDSNADAVVVGLLDAGEISTRAARVLQDRVTTGGGLLVVAGPNAVGSSWDRLFDSAGPFPLAIGPATSVVAREGGIEAASHKSIDRFAVLGEPFMPLVRVRVHRPLASSSPEWTPVLTTPESEPLLMVGEFGAGRVAVLGAVAAAAEASGERWSNLATLPTFPLLVGDIFDWLAQPSVRPKGFTTGASLPTAIAAARRVDADASDTKPVTRSLTEAGVYAAEGAPTADGAGARRFAVNVDPREGQLDRIDYDELQERFGSFASVVPAASFDSEAQTTADVSGIAGALLLALLGTERLLSLRGV